MLEHWNANMGHYCQVDCSDMAEHVPPAYGRLIAAAGALATPAPLRGPDDPWHLEVLAHPHGPRVLQARIVAPDGQPVAAAPWFIEGWDPADFRNPPDVPWVIAALLPALTDHREALEWLEDAEQCIAWAFLYNLEPTASA